MLTDDAGATMLRYHAELKLGGKLAQLGSRLIEGSTRKIADEFFLEFARQVNQETLGAAAAAVAAPQLRLRRWPAIVVAVLLALLVWWLARSN
jgi:hypothetical protein